MQCAKEGIHPRYPRKTGHQDKLLLVFESRPVMVAIPRELGEAAGRFLLAFQFPICVRFVLLLVLQTLQSKEPSERVCTKELVSKKGP
jgi:hypothetical protein